jgi:acetyl esterase
MPIDPALVAFDLRVGTAPRMARGAVERRRNALAFDHRIFETLAFPGPSVATAEHTIDVPGFVPVRFRIYYPRTSVPEAPVPAFLSFFGGGFQIGGIDYPTYDASYRHRAADSGVAIVAVDYALAPEQRYPTQVEQGYAVLQWIVRNAASVFLDPARLGIGGLSSGGNIAAAVALVNRDRAAHPLTVQVLEVPSTDLTMRSLDLSTARALKVPGFLLRYFLGSLARDYLPRRSSARQASPLRAASLAELPPTRILTAELDPLRGDGEKFAAALRRAGVDASCVRYLGLTHGSSLNIPVSASTRRWHADVVAALRSLHD